ncbi:LPO_1073/Vpar_1526 family protein [Pantoea ananatis]|uniref:LPO_1073/Vpar_1526 family protein n=1 Tax=Pantoea ananas TaxID=553 RepID=UPI0019802946|nr:LPO_1073/Vpar_1526 family protein [Pantoea ananatis]MBN6030343.1 hypothetical protein [Pantoea ananatis]
MSIFDNGLRQVAKENSIAMNAANDINITTGLSQGDIIQLFDRLFKGEFQNIQEIAKQQAILYSVSFQERLISDLSHNAERLIVERFRDPDVQATIRDAVISVARRGDKSRPELLSKLIVEKVSSTNSDFLDIVINEAINVIPKLTNKQVALICAVFVVRNLMVNSSENILSTLEGFHEVLHEKIGSDFESTQVSLNHLGFTGACTYDEQRYYDVIDIYFGKYNNFDLKTPTMDKENDNWYPNKKSIEIGDIRREVMQELEEKAPVMMRFLKGVSAAHVSGVNLTSIGIAIALTIVKDILPAKYSDFIN